MASDLNIVSELFNNQLNLFTIRAPFSACSGGVPWLTKHINLTIPFEPTSKRRKGFPSETQVKRGLRKVGGDKYLNEKLGRQDPCPCKSGKSF